MDISQIRDRQLKILKWIDRFCSDHNLRYYLWGGTLLGAVRHGGYIPWDDDIDIMMPRPDYNQLIAAISRQRGVGHPFAVHSNITRSDYPFPFAKVCDMRTVLDVESETVRGLGIYIDVFPIDCWVKGRPLMALQRTLLRILGRGIVIKHLDRRRRRRLPNAVTLRLLKLMLSPLKVTHMVKVIDALAQLGECSTSAKAGVLVWGHYEDVRIESYEPSRRLKFEDFEAVVPGNADELLKALYGDYMTPPPPEERITPHRFTAYARDTVP